MSKGPSEIIICYVDLLLFIIITDVAFDEYKIQKNYIYFK